jgi:hypothetical protein
MEIFFTDPSEIPLPPDEVRIRQLKFDLTSDGRRLKVYLELDPFQKRPNLELMLFDPAGQEISRVDIIETMSRKLELNLHLRAEPQPGEYSLQALLFYVEIPQQPDPDAEPAERQMVDSAIEKFTIE